MQPEPDVEPCDCEHPTTEEIVNALIVKIQNSEDLIALLRGPQGKPGANGDDANFDDSRVVNICKQVISTNPITVHFDKLGPAGNFIPSGSVKEVTLGGDLHIPPQMLRIRDGQEKFLIGVPLGESMKIAVEDLDLSGD